MSDLQLPISDVEPPPALPPLGPGDDDPRSPAHVGEVPPARPPLGPGESVGVNPDEGFDFLAPPPPGAGDVATGPRHVVRIPKPQPLAANDNEKE